MRGEASATAGIILARVLWRRKSSFDGGESPSGKAHGFGPCIRGFESLLPSQMKQFLIRAKL